MPDSVGRSACLGMAAVMLLCVAALAHAQTRPDIEFADLFKEVGRVLLEEPDSAPITGIQALDRFSDGRFIIVDQRGGQVRVHGPHGDFIGIVGRQGEGPGEFEDPLDAVVDSEDRFYVADHRGPILQRFDASVAYDTTLRLEDGLYPFQVEIMDDQLLVGIRKITAAPYSILSRNGVVRQSFHEWPKIILEVPYWQSVVRDKATHCGGDILIATSMVYPIQSYSRAGQRIGGFGTTPKSWKQAPKLAVGELSGPDQMKKLAEWLSKFTVIDAIDCYRSDHIIVTHGGFASSFTGWIGDLFNVHQYALDLYAAGDPPRKLAEDVPVPGTILHVDEHVYMLLATPPDPWTIGIFELDLSVLRDPQPPGTP